MTEENRVVKRAMRHLREKMMHGRRQPPKPKAEKVEEENTLPKKAPTKDISHNSRYPFIRL